MKKILSSLIQTAAISAIVSTANASVISVNAGSDGWTGWKVTNSSTTEFADAFLDPDPPAIIGVNGQAWGLRAKNLATIGAAYGFGQVLSVGNSVTISVSLGNMDGGSVVGFGLQDGDGNNLLECYYVGGGTDAWKLNDGAQEDITGPVTTWGYSSSSNNTKQTIEFTLLAGNEYSLSFNGVEATNTGMYLSASNISQVRIFNYNAGDGASNDQYFNSLTVIPEPGTLGLVAFGALVVGAGTRRRKAWGTV
jgi:hypothetical protein